MQSHNPAIEIRVAKESDIEILAEVMATSFCYDPAFTWMTDNHTERFDALVGFFRVMVKHGMNIGIVHAAEMNKIELVGVSIWLPHDSSDEKVDAEIEKAVGNLTVQFELFADLLSSCYPPATPYFQLMAVGIHPKVHGIGIGSQLLCEQLKEFDKMGMPTYLEASTRRSSTGIYERLNYQPVGEIIHFPNDAEIFPMWRIAQDTDTALLIDDSNDDKEYPTIDSIIQFGKYDWRVLDVQQNMTLLLCDKVIESRKYNERFEPVSWETASLRKYLNNEFYHTFTDEEKARIMNVKITTYSNPWFGTNEVTETMDNVFLLGIDGVVKYFGDSKQLRSRNANTKYTISDHFNWARKAVNMQGEATNWLLRSPGNNPCFVINVSSDGRISVSGDFVNREGYPYGGIRPALWIKV
ncbi:MAG: DUF6273 domain-containing protein [Defluviitaleaceae bacterium]|nr:DUF6273 domain-containing protein [Defluviitaleaceae bacterium]MCL2276115.1 DUF6273 domain-containing protein [Defluviitaleaceae bacterium]